MADKIQIYAGKKATMPQLLPRELGYCTDTQELFIGSVNDGNKLVGAVAWETDISTLQGDVTTIKEDITALKTDKLTANKAASVATLATDATQESIITAVNDLISSLKAAGVMSA